MDSMIGKSFIRLCFLNFFLQAHFVSPSVIVDVPVEATKPRELSTADCIVSKLISALTIIGESKTFAIFFIVSTRPIL